MHGMTTNISLAHIFREGAPLVLRQPRQEIPPQHSIRLSNGRFSLAIFFDLSEKCGPEREGAGGERERGGAGRGGVHVGRASLGGELS